MVTLTNVGTSYDAIAASKGLGICLIDFTGKTSLTLAVYRNRIGTGTLSWQVWNVTNAAEIAVITDSGATGDLLVQQTFAISLTGVKMVRIRCKSTVAGDDPVYYDGTILVS
jgi:hypothetical protein